MKAGTYYVGDPCYVLSDKDWQKILGDDGFSQLKGHEIFFAGTNSGDGTYLDNLGNEYGVDTGCIGILPVEVCLKGRLKDITKRNLGQVHVFDSEFEVYVSGGNFTFGDIEIITDGSDEEKECNCDCHWR